MPITPFIAAILTLFYVGLSFIVISQRLKHKVSLGSSLGGRNIDSLQQAVRAHANFAEYVPMALLLLWFLESIVYAHLMVLILGGVLVLGRFFHVLGVLNPSRFRLRQIGVLLTFAVLISAAVQLLWYYLPIGI